jgi:hypothetical protein
MSRRYSRDVNGTKVAQQYRPRKESLVTYLDRNARRTDGICAVGRVTVLPRLSVRRKAKHQQERALENLVNPGGGNAVHGPELEGVSLIACMIEYDDCDTDLEVLSTVRDFAHSRRPGACHCLVAPEGAVGAPAENQAPKAMAISASGRGQATE